jgi:hypothetical protein
MPEPDFDFLGLLELGRHATVRFGTTEAASGLVHANMTSAINQMPDATLVVDLGRVPGPIDYFSPLQIGTRSGDEAFPRFTGAVTTAEPTDEGVALTALGGVSMVERLIGATAAKGVPAAELFYLLARTGGLHEEQLRVEGLDQLPTETFEVVSPIEGLEIDRPTDFAGVQLLPREVGLRVLSGLELEDDFRARFDAPAYGLSLVTTQGMYGAEQNGLAEIDLALAWLTTRLRYGLAELPDGARLAFSRDQSLHPIRRLDLVAVRGLMTGRQWLREPASHVREIPLALETRDQRLRPHLRPVSMQERQALLALRRATTESDLVARLLALWEGIEFYCAGVAIDDLFTKTERKALKRAMPEEFSDVQKAKLGFAIDGLNEPPLMVRLQALVDEHGVPIADGEWQLLGDLRRLRNNVVHGRARESPRADEIDQAISIVARFLVFALERPPASTNCEA